MANYTVWTLSKNSGKAIAVLTGLDRFSAESLVQRLADLYGDNRAWIEKEIQVNGTFFLP